MSETKESNTALIKGFGVLAETIKTCCEHELSMFVYGRPGVGKSASVEQAARDLDYGCTIVDCTAIDALDVHGLPRVVSEDRAEFLPYGVFYDIVNAKQPMIVNFDDLSQADISVQKAIMRVLWDRKIGRFAIPEHVRFFATGNSREDRAGASGLIEPLKSRFSSLVQFQPDVDDWIEGYAVPQNVDPLIVAYLKVYPDAFSAFVPRADFVQSPTPRTWAHCAKILAAQFDSAVEFSLIQGAIGPEHAGKFIHMREILKKMPDPTDILMQSPDRKLATKIGEAGNATVFTLAAVLGTRIGNEAQLKNALVFLGMIGPEPAELALMVATKKKPALMDTRTYSEFSTGTLKA